MGGWVRGKRETQRQRSQSDSRPSYQRPPLPPSRPSPASAAGARACAAASILASIASEHRIEVVAELGGPGDCALVHFLRALETGAVQRLLQRLGVLVVHSLAGARAGAAASCVGASSAVEGGLLGLLLGALGGAVGLVRRPPREGAVARAVGAQVAVLAEDDGDRESSEGVRPQTSQARARRRSARMGSQTEWSSSMAARSALVAFLMALLVAKSLLSLRSAALTAS